MSIYRHLSNGKTLDEAMATILKNKRTKAAAAAPKQTVGIKYPSLLSPQWRLALGIGAE
ncbi:hypothetical protein [Vibrio navarrensis]|uniref:hypothetical protein n=1 Tax=Vibrio navarrensis TaxID=29495 RepID=UPI0018DB240E|nr:hypothetical protein [Vibrio navarrensis]